MTFRHVLAADVVAMGCALALLFVMGIDWYGTGAGDEARRIERLTRPQGALGAEVARAVDAGARAGAERAEKNAVQASAAIDRVILLGMLATVLPALAAGFLRRAGRRFEPPLTPSALAAAGASASAVLVAYRMAQEPGLDAATTVKSGAPLALALLVGIGLCCAVALRAEEAGTAWRPEGAATPGEDRGGAEPAGGEASIESAR